MGGTGFKSKREIFLLVSGYLGLKSLDVLSFGRHVGKHKASIDASLKQIHELIIDEIGFVEAAKQIIARASPGDRALILGMAKRTPSRPATSVSASKPFKTLTAKQIASLWQREKYRDRKRRSENAPDFIKRVYADLLNNGLVRADFRRKSPQTGEVIDMPLYNALADWSAYHGGMPDDLDLPSEPQTTERAANTPEGRIRAIIAYANRAARKMRIDGF